MCDCWNIVQKAIQETPDSLSHWHLVLDIDMILQVIRDVHIENIWSVNLTVDIEFQIF